MRIWVGTAALALAAGVAHAEVKVPVHAVTAAGPGAELGTITLEAAHGGTLIRPALTGLPSGLRGFHLHENGDCGPAEKDGQVVPAGAAGSHYDPKGHGHHRGPYAGDGHRGDLPALFVDEGGAATVPVLAPGAKPKAFAGRALVIHAGSDTYADEPPLGGGGARIACGVVPK